MANSAPGNQFAQNFQSLSGQLGREQADARYVVARPSQACHEAGGDRIDAGRELIGIVWLAAMAACMETMPRWRR